MSDDNPVLPQRMWEGAGRNTAQQNRDLTLDAWDDGDTAAGLTINVVEGDDWTPTSVWLDEQSMRELASELIARADLLAGVGDDDRRPQ